MSSTIPPEEPPGPASVGSEKAEKAASGVAAVAPPKRPRYLVLALVVALIFGAGCWTEGCARMAFFRGEHDSGAALNSRIHDDVERAKSEQLFQRYVDASDHERNLGIPLAIATFVLGAALLALASRGLAGKSNTRSALMQIVAAQAIVVGVTYFATRETRIAEADWEWQAVLFERHEQLPPDQFEQIVPMVHWMQRYIPPGWLVVRTTASALILLALTRKRSREFFEGASAAPASES